MPAYQFSLKQLLGATAYCAVLAWCVSRGSEGGFYWISVGLCLLNTCVWLGVTSIARKRVWGVMLPFCWAAASGMFLSCIGGLPVLANAFLLAGGSLVLTETNSRLHNYAAYCFIASLVIGTIPGLFLEISILGLRSEFPKQELRSRLAYELVRPQPLHSNSPINAELESSLVADDIWLTGGPTDRNDDLRRIHSAQYLTFVRAAGFGWSRMLQPSRDMILAPPVAQQESDFGQMNDHRLWRVPSDAESPPPLHFHNLRRFRFLHEQSFGHHFSKEPAVEIAGFLPHAFYRTIPARYVAPDEPWTVERLELVSLLKFSEPRVYVLDHLPRMDELSAKNAPTRELDDFEREALEKLRTTEDVVVNDQHPEVRMLGALRASNKCLECHNVPRGALLGAFSYRLRPFAPGQQNPSAADAALP